MAAIDSEQSEKSIKKLPSVSHSEIGTLFGKGGKNPVVCTRLEVSTTPGVKVPRRGGTINGLKNTKLKVIKNANQKGVLVSH